MPRIESGASDAKGFLRLLKCRACLGRNGFTPDAKLVCVFATPGKTNKRAACSLTLIGLVGVGNFHKSYTTHKQPATLETRVWTAGPDSEAARAFGGSWFVCVIVELYAENLLMV